MTDTSPTTETGESSPYVLTVTPEALERVCEIRDGEDDPGAVALRVEITGSSGNEFTYDLAFADVSSLDADDDVAVQGTLTVVVAAASVADMRGAVLDLPSAPGQGGLVIRNPNRPARVDPMAGREILVTGEIADAVNALLAETINPSLAEHGGFAQLVGVDDSTVFVTMGGGCQGCAMSAMTLREGITLQILDAVPAVTEVIDVTDHDAGASPFYAKDWSRPEQLLSSVNYL